jgi:hypothetical protein
MRFRLLLLLTVAASGGCTHLQLDRSTLRQVGTVTDIQYRQILTGLAMTHADPDVLPHFAVVGTGGTAVSDEGTATVELEWDPTTLARKLLGLGASRQVEEQWTLAPVVNPDKLRAIRCAYQLVVCGSSSDPECDTLLTAFLGPGYAEWVRRGWFAAGGRKDVPKGACYVGHCGDHYVWVAPGGLDGLTRLTIAVLNIATLDPTPPPDPPTKTVQKHTYKDGQLDTIETYTRPDPDAPKPAAVPVRKDFYNPLQTQVQLRGKGR